MHPNQVTPEIISKFGEPTVLNSLGIPIVNFPSGRSGLHYTKRFGLANCLENPEAQALFNSLRNPTDEDLKEVQRLEGLPDSIQLVPEVSKKVSRTAQQARLSDLAWDQQFFNSFRFILQCLRDTKEGTSCYPLIQGPPGASKTQVAVAVSAVVGRPVYPVVGGDGAADEIKAALLGGPFPSDKEPWAIAKENAYIGGLQEPQSERYLLRLLQEKTFEAITHEEFQQLAALEGIRAGITYEKKGAYQLAAENGGILLLEECNSFPAEVHSLLTQILENYITGDIHPNFFIIATQNPAGEKHPSRNPLPKEVVNRFELFRVAVPSQEQYYQALNYMLTREQPTISLGDREGVVTPSILGVDIPPAKPNPLANMLTPKSLQTFIANLTKFHKAIEEKIESGVLDPKDVEEPQTKETTFLSRRNLRRLLNGIENEIHCLSHIDEPGVISWKEYITNATSKGQHTTTKLSNAVWSAIHRYYISPNSFNTHQTVEITNKDGNNTNHLLTNTEEILMSLARSCKVDLASLKQILMTATDIKAARAKFEAQYNQAMANLGATKNKMAHCLEHFQKLEPSQQERCALVKHNNTVTLAYPLFTDAIQHLEGVCPLLGSADNDLKKTETLLQKLEKRRKDIEKNGMQYLTTEDIVACKAWVNALREKQFSSSSSKKPLFFIPVFYEVQASMAYCLIASIHTSFLNQYNSAGKEVALTATQQEELNRMLASYSATNSYINATFVLTPRSIKNAITSPPMHALNNGLTSSTRTTNSVPPFKLGKNAPVAPAFLELVKYVEGL